MSQPLSQAQNHLNATALLNTIHNQPQRTHDPLENIQRAKERFVEAGSAFGLLAQQDLVMPVREKLLELIQLERDINCFQKALQQLPLRYQPSMEPTDWKALLQQLAADADKSSKFDPRHDAALKDFDKEAHVQLAGGAGADKASEEEEELDDDLAVVGGDEEKNARCPYTGKPVAELEEPVEDRKGFVYEKAAVVGALRAHAGAMACPVAGANHTVQLADLRPCKRLLRARKAARLARVAAMVQNTQANQAGSSKQAQQ